MKTEVLSLTTSHDSHAAPFSVHGDRLVESREFMYLGSILSDDCSVNSEIEHRIKAASSAFGRLLHRIFLNHNLAVPTKVLLYRCEAWTPYRRHIKALEAFHICCLYRLSLVSAGGRKYHKLSRSRRPILPQSSTCWCKGNCVGSGT